MWVPSRRHGSARRSLYDAPRKMYQKVSMALAGTDAWIDRWSPGPLVVGTIRHGRVWPGTTMSSKSHEREGLSYSHRRRTRREFGEEATAAIQSGGRESLDDAFTLTEDVDSHCESLTGPAMIFSLCLISTASVCLSIHCRAMIDVIYNIIIRLL